MIAADPSPAVHLGLLGAIVLIALIVYTVVRTRRRREAAEAERLNQLAHSTGTSTDTPQEKP